VERIIVGTIWWRIHRAEHEPLRFGPSPGTVPHHRFDAPAGEYRVAYVGGTREASFAEVLLREPDVDYIAMDEIRARRLTRIRVRRAMAIVALHGPGLVRAGISAAATTGDDDPRSRQMAHRIWAGPEHPDGVTYRARHDDGEMSVALFDRAADAIEVVESVPLDDDPPWLASLAIPYGVEFIP
jgi:hypothetical protein